MCYAIEELINKKLVREVQAPSTWGKVYEFDWYNISQLTPEKNKVNIQVQEVDGTWVDVGTQEI